MTGAGAAGDGFGVQILSVRQSSLPRAVAPAPTNGHAAGSLVASSVAGAHVRAGGGGFHRNSPDGGAANGMPVNAHDEPRSSPCTDPAEVAARHVPREGRSLEVATQPVAAATTTMAMTTASRETDMSVACDRQYVDRAAACRWRVLGIFWNLGYRELCVTVDPGVVTRRIVTETEPRRTSSPSRSADGAATRSPRRCVPFLLPRSSMVALSPETRIRA